MFNEWQIDGKIIRPFNTVDSWQAQEEDNITESVSPFAVIFAIAMGVLAFAYQAGDHISIGLKLVFSIVAMGLAYSLYYPVLICAIIFGVIKLLIAVHFF